jgi:pimeloyl-ACP methyl ester carboxylesterase
LITAAVVILAILGAGLLYQAIGLRLDRRRCAPIGRLVDIGDRRLHVYETGAGGLTVVLEAGIAATSLSWSLVQPRIAEFARVVSYDRAGLGWSDASDQPCTPSQLARDLHTALAAAEIPPPYVLVAHSFGGLVARRFASDYSELTAGLVLVDALHPSEWNMPTDQQRATLARGARLSRRGALLAHFGVVRASLALLTRGQKFLPKLAARASSGRGASVTQRLAAEVGKLPRAVWPHVASHWSNPKSFQAMSRYLEGLPASSAEMINAAPLDRVPVIVITAPDCPAPRRNPANVAPNAVHIVAAGSGHWIQLDEPGLIVEAVRQLVST